MHKYKYNSRNVCHCTGSKILSSSKQSLTIFWWHSCAGSDYIGYFQISFRNFWQIMSQFGLVQTPIFNQQNAKMWIERNHIWTSPTEKNVVTVVSPCLTQTGWSWIECHIQSSHWQTTPVRTIQCLYILN